VDDATATSSDVLRIENYTATKHFPFPLCYQLAMFIFHDSLMNNPNNP
jgi:hypothetical protein